MGKQRKEIRKNGNVSVPLFDGKRENYTRGPNQKMLLPGLPQLTRQQ